MKKFILCLLCFLVLFPGKSISAASIEVKENKTLLYYSSTNKIGVWYQSIYVDGKFSYCLQFEEKIVSGANHKEEEPSKYYSESQWERISLYAMYAEHLYSKTQNMNYRYAGSALIHGVTGDNMIFYDYSSGSKKQYDISKYKTEIEAMYQKHISPPKFEISETDFKVGNTYEFEDTNKSLSSYVVDDASDNIKVELDDNKMKVEVLASGVSTFTLTSDVEVKDGYAKLLTSSSYQDLAVVSSYTPATVNYEFESSVKTGDISISKLDTNTEEFISGAEFTLRKLIDGVYVDIDNYTVNEQLLLTDMEVGSYQLVETKAPEGYELTGEVYEFEVLEGEVTYVEVFNSKILPKTGLNVQIFPYILLLFSVMLVISKNYVLKQVFNVDK